MTGFFCRPFTPLEKAQADKLLLKFVVGDPTPFSIVKGQFFREFISFIQPSYEMPCRTTLSRSHMPRKFAEMEASVMENVRAIDAVSLTTEIWTSRTTTANISVTAHCVTKDWVMKSSLLGCIAVSGSHTAIMIRNELVQVRFANQTFKQLETYRLTVKFILTLFYSCYL